jgi:hypothetical protein
MKFIETGMCWPSMRRLWNFHTQWPTLQLGHNAREHYQYVYQYNYSIKMVATEARVLWKSRMDAHLIHSSIHWQSGRQGPHQGFRT